MADDLVNACPRCDLTDLYKRVTLNPPWRCKRCGHEFEEPLQREVVQSFKSDHGGPA